MKCIICEKTLDPVSNTSIAQPYDGGEVRVRFDYGSRFDQLGSRCAILEEGYTDNEANLLGIGDGEWKPMKSKTGIIGSYPDPEYLKSDDRVRRLLSCSHILGIICDDCFEKKAHLFQGYERNINGRLDLLVD